jgi:hypothetical protein
MELSQRQFLEACHTGNLEFVLSSTVTDANFLGGYDGNNPRAHTIRDRGRDCSMLAIVLRVQIRFAIETCILDFLNTYLQL